MRFESKSVTWTMLILMTWLSIATMASKVASAEPEADAGRDTQIMAVLDEYMDALNALDIERHVATYQFPHYRHASGEIVIWKTPREAMPILDLPMSERKEAVRGILAKDWDRSVWTKRDIVQGDATKVHVATQFVRLRKDGSKIATYDSLYVLTRDADGWGIKGRSSFAP
jgi:hypothetical protein